MLQDQDLVDVLKIDGNIQMLPEGLVSGRELVRDGAEASPSEHHVVVLVLHAPSGHDYLDIVHKTVVHATEQQRVGSATRACPGHERCRRHQADTAALSAALEKFAAAGCRDYWVIFTFMIHVLVLLAVIADYYTEKKPLR